MRTAASTAAFLLLSALSGLSVSAWGAPPPNSKNVVVHRDDEAGFILQYPHDWSPVPATHQRTRIKIVSERGAGGEDCIVNVHHDEKFRHLSPPEALRQLSDPRAFQQGLRSAIPDATVVGSARTHLSHQEAVAFVVRFTFRSVGLEGQVKMIIVRTVRNGRLYTVGCRAGEEQFDHLMPTFQTIFAGFLIKN